MRDILLVVCMAFPSPFDIYVSLFSWSLTVAPLLQSRPLRHANGGESAPQLVRQEDKACLHQVISHIDHVVLKYLREVEKSLKGAFSLAFIFFIWFPPTFSGPPSPTTRAGRAHGPERHAAVPVGWAGPVSGALLAWRFASRSEGCFSGGFCFFLLALPLLPFLCAQG